MKVKDTLEKDPYKFWEDDEKEAADTEIDENLEALILDQLDKDYKFGTNSWDL